MTCSDDEAVVWSTKHDQPILLLDEPSRDNTLQRVSSFKIGKQTLLAFVSAAEISVFRYDKGGQSSVKPCDSRFTLGDVKGQ